MSKLDEEENNNLLPLSELEGDAIKALSSICRDNDAPSAAKAQAARTILEYTGAIGRHAEPPDRSGQLSDSELTEEDIDRLLVKNNS